MECEAFDLFCKELRRLAEQGKRDGRTTEEIVRKISERVEKVPDRRFTAEQTGEILKLVVKQPVRRLGETTYWIHWESGEIHCAGRDLDKVKALAEEQAEENGQAYFIT